jgi:hypothetical protein
MRRAQRTSPCTQRYVCVSAVMCCAAVQCVSAVHCMGMGILQSYINHPPTLPLTHTHTQLHRNFEHMDGNWAGHVYLRGDYSSLWNLSALCLEHCWQLPSPEHGSHGFGHAKVRERGVCCCCCCCCVAVLLCAICYMLYAIY